MTQETFAVWCAEYKARLDEEQALINKKWEGKPTGKELFEKNSKFFDDLVIDLDDSEPVIIEESKKEESDENDFQIERELYEEGDLENVDFEEDVDFD